MLRWKDRGSSEFLPLIHTYSHLFTLTHRLTHRLTVWGRLLPIKAPSRGQPKADCGCYINVTKKEAKKQKAKTTLKTHRSATGDAASPNTPAENIVLVDNINPLGNLLNMQNHRLLHYIIILSDSGMIVDLQQSAAL